MKNEHPQAPVDGAPAPSADQVEVLRRMRDAAKREVHDVYNLHSAERAEALTQVVALDAAIAALSAPVALPVAWECRIAKRGGAFGEWHACTQEQYDSIRLTGHYNGPGGALSESRALCLYAGTAPAASPRDGFDWFAECRRVLEDVATEMRATGRGESRFRRLIESMPRANQAPSPSVVTDAAALAYEIRERARVLEWKGDDYLNVAAGELREIADKVAALAAATQEGGA